MITVHCTAIAACGYQCTYTNKFGAASCCI